MENIKGNDLLDLLRNQYMLDITDQQYNTLKSILTLHNVTPMMIKIELENTIENFINNMHLTKKIDVNRMKVIIDEEDVLYIMNPIAYGFDEKYKVGHPTVGIDRRYEISPDDYKDMKQNIALIRSTFISKTVNESIHEDKFTLMIYNEDLNVTAGIMFESLE
jgi:hypothetical protein